MTGEVAIVKKITKRYGPVIDLRRSPQTILEIIHISARSRASRRRGRRLSRRTGAPT